MRSGIKIEDQQSKVKVTDSVHFDSRLTIHDNWTVTL